MNLLPSFLSRASNPALEGIGKAYDRMLREWPLNAVPVLQDFPVNVEELEHSYRITADLPGFKKEDIEIVMNEGNMTIQAKHAEKSEKKDARFLLKERSCQSLSRTLELPFAGHKSSVDAELRNGVLTVTVEKDKDRTAKKIHVK